MGEGRRKSRRRAEILRGETRCIYCSDFPTTVEHMPPRSMFAQSHRLSGLEFASCRECNFSTRAADCAAAFFTRLSPTNIVDELELAEAFKLTGTLSQIAPGFVSEIFDKRRSKEIWAHGRDPILGRKVQIVADGEITQTLLRVFSAKLGMALFREHTGRPLPLDGLVFSQHYLNAGLSQDEAEATLRILPTLGELRMGRQRSGKNFSYRFNTDGKTIVASLAAFNNNFYVRNFAVSDPLFFDPLMQSHLKEPIRPGQFPKLAEAWAPSK